MLTIFNDVFILTYLSDGSETNAWLDLFSTPFRRYELIKASNGSFVKCVHNCKYSGSRFENLLKIYDDKINDIGKKVARAKGEPLTKRWFEEKSKSHKDITTLRNNTRTFFRNTTKDKTDMLWTCFKDSRVCLRDSRFDPKAGQQTWLQQAERGTNLYAKRHFLAFLVNVYPPVELETFFRNHKVNFRKDNYALSRVLQWTWRSAIRNDESVTLYLPSERMRGFVKEWLK